MEREFKDSGIEWIGRIPKEWKVKKVKYLADSISKGNGITKEEVFADGDIPCVRYGEIYSKYDNSFKQCHSLTYRDLHKTPRYFQKGDILFAGTGELVEEIGKNVVYLGNDKCLAGGDIIILSHHQNASFLNYAMNSHYAQSQKSRGKAKLKVVHISASEIGDINVILPPLPEQQRIADYLDKKCGEIDELIALQEQMIAQLTDYKQSVITEAVTKGLNPDAEFVPSGIDWIGAVPKGWKVCRFKSIAAVKANLVSPDLYLDYPQVAPDNIEKGSGKLLSWKKVKEAGIISDNHLFFKGQIVYSKIRPMLNKVIIAPFDGLCSADMYPIETKLVSKYLLYYMLSSLFTQQVQRYVNDRVKMPKINKEEIANILTIIPSESEQHTIATYLDTKCSEIDSLIAIKQQKIETLKDYKKSVIYEAVTGKMTV